jgi:hypothetical protein
MYYAARVFFLIIFIKYDHIQKIGKSMKMYVQSNLSYVTFQGSTEIGSLKTGGHLIQV